MFFAVELLIFIFFLLNFAESIKVQRRIAGGEKAKPGHFPHAVLLMHEGQYICTGSIITKEWILTVSC
jgi:secreted trypsin-like serine protease